MNRMEKKPPPDGGFRAISVVVGSFLCNGLIFGLVNSYSVLNDEFVKIFEKIGEPNARPKAGTYVRSFHCVGENSILVINVII